MNSYKQWNIKLWRDSKREKEFKKGSDSERMRTGDRDRHWIQMFYALNKQTKYEYKVYYKSMFNITSLELTKAFD